jgi:hypothetical protein
MMPDVPLGALDGPRTPRNLVGVVRASLTAKLERLLDRPLIGRVASVVTDAEREVASVVNDAELEEDDAELPDAFRALRRAALERTSSSTSRSADPWREDPEDGTVSVGIVFDYDDLWRGREKDVLETVSSAVENTVAFLTSDQKLLLERSPREFLAQSSCAGSAELVSFETDRCGGTARVVELKLAAAPESRAQVRYLAVVPNLVQIERQLDALRTIESAEDAGPLAPLRALLGLCDSVALGAAPPMDREPAVPGERLDEHQAECVHKAMATPHYAVIQGPPGSGKTTVITAIIRRALARGEHVLVVSPTHVAVDNVVEKLTSRSESAPEDQLEPWSLPVRYASRIKKLSERALAYWVGRNKQRRSVSIARRIEHRLVRTVPFAEALYALEDTKATGNGPLSSAVAGVEAVICGTPIGILSYETVKQAGPASFDLLIVDEVSKMTLPEFLAVAVKARRWVLVGDPEQLPPFNDSEENGTTLDDVIDPLLEVACSVGGILERAKPGWRQEERLVVVSAEPARAVAAIREHLAAVKIQGCPAVTTADEARNEGVIVCAPSEVDDACTLLSSVRERDRTHNPDRVGGVGILVERGVVIPRPEAASGNRLVEPGRRAPALIFENAFNVYHAQPWSRRAHQKLALLTMRNGIEKYLPSGAALDALADHTPLAPPRADRRALIDAISERFAVNTISVYDWLTGIPTAFFDCSPLRELEALSPEHLTGAVRPFVGTLKKQYRMHSSLSLVPRGLFYFGEALHDGRPDERGGCRVTLVRVEREGAPGETNEQEVDVITDLLTRLNADDAARKHRPGIMVITPYKKQEERLREALGAMRGSDLVNLDIEVCTLDRCQGREAEYVLISLVRDRATAFLDMPKRWNVALTRAMQGLFIVGDVDAYLREAGAARRHPRSRAQRSQDGTVREGVPMMSLLARIIEAYDHHTTRGSRRAVREAM